VAGDFWSRDVCMWLVAEIRQRLIVNRDRGGRGWLVNRRQKVCFALMTQNTSHIHSNSRISRTLGNLEKQQQYRSGS
jgi:hypothetical protein